MYQNIKLFFKKIFPKNLWLKLLKLKQRITNYYQLLENKKLIKKTYIHYKEVEKQIIQRKYQKLRFASYVIYDSTFSAYGLMELMLADKEKYDAKIVIIPDVARGDDVFVNQYQNTKQFFVNLYGKENILDGYDFEKKEFIDLSDQFDIINLSSPYDNMANKVHGIQYLSTKNVLPIYISYGCMPDYYGCKEIMPRLEISLFWKVFADNKISFKDYKKNEISKGKNVICTGYAKMDNLAKAKIIKHDKKRIIIAPHHTVNNPSLPLSNFLEYFDFILELPKLYPEIQFIFRPHPLLFINLVNQEIWTKQQVDDYLYKLQNLGIEYSYGGNYFDIFANSDAMIHDCSSFVVEYLYTGKPCCFVAKSNYKKIFSTLGKSCLKNYYLAFNKEQIISFINDIINGNDRIKEKRIQFANKYLKINYPDVSKRILKEISL